MILVAYICYVKFGMNDASISHATATVDAELPMTVSAYDTTAVLTLANEYLTYVKEGDFDAALDMLYVLDEDDLPIPINSEHRQMQRIALTLYPIFDYKIDKLTFWRQTDSRLDYSIIVTQPEDGREPAHVRCALRPVRYSNQWYLTIADDRQLNENSEIN